MSRKIDIYQILLTISFKYSNCTNLVRNVINS